MNEHDHSIEFHVSDAHDKSSQKQSVHQSKSGLSGGNLLPCQICKEMRSYSKEKCRSKGDGRCERKNR